MGEEKSGEREKGLVYLNTGTGKGKTTSALGLALRAIGHGLKVYCVQFMKGRSDSGELLAAKHLPGFVLIQAGSNNFIPKGKPSKQDAEMAENGLEVARKAAESGDYDIVILDEINVAVDYGLIELKDVLELIKNRARKTSLVLTGRYAHPRLLDAADEITELTDVKHPLEKRLMPKKGIDY